MANLRNKAYMLLRSSEGIFKTDMVYLARGGSWLTLGQVLSAAIALGNSIILANFLDQNSYGIYKYIMTVIGFLSVANLGGLNSSVSQEIVKGGEGIVMPAFWTKAKWGLFGTAIGIGGSIYYLLKGNPLYAVLFAIIAVFIPVSESFPLYDSVLQAKKDFKRSVLYSTSIQLISTAVLAGAIVAGQPLLVVISAYLISLALARFYFFKLSLKLVEKTSYNPEAISYGKYLSFVGLLNNLSDYADRLAIYYLLGPVELAIYSIAIAPPDQIKAVLKNLKFLSFPKFANKTAHEIKENLSYRLMLLGLGVVLISIAYIISAPYIYHLLFPKYIASISFSQVYSASIFAITIALILETALVAVGAKKQIAEYNLINNISSVAVLVAATYFWGLWGAVAARIINRVVMLISGSLLFEKAARSS